MAYQGTVKVVEGKNDPEFILYEKDFYSNFIPDDWDYIVVGSNRSVVENVASQLAVLDYDIKPIVNAWMAVTYHS
jgi:hypothetical protein